MMSFVNYVIIIMKNVYKNRKMRNKFNMDDTISYSDS